MKKTAILLITIAFLAISFLAGLFFGKQRGAPDAKEPTRVIYNTGNVYDACPESVLESIVAVEVFDEDGESIANASGFIAFSDKRLVTCRHALANMEYAICTTEAGETFRIDTIVSADEKTDIAICLVPAECTLPSMKLSDRTPEKGEGVTAIGSWYGMVNVVTRGNAAMIKDDYILFTASVNPGASGGVLLNNEYEVCGVIRGTYSDGQSINVAVPIASVIDLAT